MNRGISPVGVNFGANKKQTAKVVKNSIDAYYDRELKNIRKFQKYTQEKLAELIDIDVRQIARIEAGESLPSLETFIKISDVLQVTPNDLLNFTSKELTASEMLKSDINDILSLAKDDQLQLIKKLILAVL